MLAAQSKVQIWLALSKKNRWQASCTKMDHIRHLDSRRAACMDQPASYTQALGMEYLEIWFVKPGSIIGATCLPSIFLGQCKPNLNFRKIDGRQVAPRWTTSDTLIVAEQPVWTSLHLTHKHWVWNILKFGSSSLVASLVLSTCPCAFACPDA